MLHYFLSNHINLSYVISWNEMKMLFIHLAYDTNVFRAVYEKKNSDFILIYSVKNVLI